jgi:hypothetical protein
MCGLSNPLCIWTIEKHTRPSTLFPPEYGQAAMMAAPREKNKNERRPTPASGGRYALDRHHPGCGDDYRKIRVCRHRFQGAPQ